WISFVVERMVSAVCGRGAHPGESRVVGHAETDRSNSAAKRHRSKSKGLRYQFTWAPANAAASRPPRRRVTASASGGCPDTACTAATPRWMHDRYNLHPDRGAALRHRRAREPV